MDFYPLVTGASRPSPVNTLRCVGSRFHFLMSTAPHSDVLKPAFIMPANWPHHGIVHDLAPKFFESFQQHDSLRFR